MTAHVERYVRACLPRVDGAPFYSSRLGGCDPDATGAFGLWAIDIENLGSVTQFYRRNTVVLHTTFTDTMATAARCSIGAGAARARGALQARLDLTRERIGARLRTAAGRRSATR